ncbi:hypothetical protein V8C35DRAFT_330157 [Trichoderma chlorosporum]
MAPGYRSPFDHPPSLKPIHSIDGLLPILAVLLCVSIVLCLALFIFDDTPKHDHHNSLEVNVDTSVPVQEMALDGSIPKNPTPQKDLCSQQKHVAIL